MINQVLKIYKSFDSLVFDRFALCFHTHPKGETRMATAYLDDLLASLAHIDSKILEAIPFSEEREHWKSMKTKYIEAIKAEEEWINNGAYSNAETHYSHDQVRTHANQRNRAGAQAHSYWKRRSRKTERINDHAQLMEAISDWHVQLAEEAEEAEAARRREAERWEHEYLVNDFNDHIDDIWEEHIGQPALIPPQPTRQEMEDEAWAIYERCPLLRFKQQWGLR